MSCFERLNLNPDPIFPDLISLKEVKPLLLMNGLSPHCTNEFSLKGQTLLLMNETELAVKTIERKRERFMIVYSL